MPTVHRPWPELKMEIVTFVNTCVDLTMRCSGPPWGGLMGKGREIEQSGARGTESTLALSSCEPHHSHYYVKRRWECRQAWWWG